MPPINPNVEPMNGADLLDLESALQTVTGFNRVKPALSFQREFFGLMGTAILVRQPNGSFFPMAITNVPNYDDSQEETQEQDEENDSFEEQEDDENETDFGEDTGDEFHALAQSIVNNLAPCFQHEKQTRFFADFNALTEFVSMELAARFQGYKLMIIPIIKKNDKKVKALIVSFTNDDSEYLNEDDSDGMTRMWSIFARSMKLID